MKLKTIAVPYGMREGSGTIADGMTVSFSEMWQAGFDVKIEDRI